MSVLSVHVQHKFNSNVNTVVHYGAEGNTVVSHSNYLNSRAFNNTL